jgi:4-hydroxybenzoate polyprenyltransferase
VKLKPAKYFSLVKFSHTIFAMPFAMTGFFLGYHDSSVSFDLKLFILVILCMVFARNSAMGFNRITDKDYDIKNLRTAQREIPQGVIKSNSALIFVLINVILFIFATFFINNICLYLSPVALFVILIYSFTKRFTALCHFILGIGLSLAPIGAYLSVTGGFAVLPLIFSLIVLFWVTGFDIIYALQDEEFDKSQNLRSIPVFLGKSKALILSSLLHFISACLVLLAGYYGGFKFYYLLGSFIFIAMLIYQHLIIKPDDLTKVNLAFATTNGFASIIFAVFTILDLFCK